MSFVGAPLLFLGGGSSFVGSVSSFVGGGLVCGWWIHLRVVQVVRGWGLMFVGGADVRGRWLSFRHGGPPFRRVVIVLCRSCGCCEKGMGNGGVLT